MPSMRIGINCLRIDPSYVGGVNSYTFGLLGGFAAMANGHRFQLYVTRANRRLFHRQADDQRFEVIVVDNISYALRRRLAQAMLLARSTGVYKAAADLAFESIQRMIDDGSHVSYTPTTVLQSFNSRKPTVLSMHDIQHVHFPEFFGWPRRLSRSITYGLSARYADYFQVSSEFIKTDLLSHFRGLSPERVEVIPEGVDVMAFSAPRDKAAVRERHGLPERFLFLPAQLWPHKNHLTVLCALRRLELAGERIPLVMTGARYSAASAIMAFIAENQMDYVHYLGKVGFEDLVALYQAAVCVVAPSLYESSCLPVLEAAAAGTPIIASRIPPNEEVARNLRLNLFGPRNVGELSELIFQLWHDERTAAAQSTHNRSHIGIYGWEHAAGGYLRLFERIAN